MLVADVGDEQLLDVGDSFAISSPTSLTPYGNLLSKCTVHKLHFQSDDIIIIGTTHG